MKLPQLNYQTQKNKSEIVELRGINYSDNFRDGDLAVSKNLSARRYPYITTRKARVKQTAYSNASSMTAWGKLVVVQGTDLLYDGTVVGEVTNTPKQFAVVNTKLVIFPDKVYLDLNSQTLRPLGAEASGIGATFTTNTLTISTASNYELTGDYVHFCNYEAPQYNPPSCDVQFKNNGAYIDVSNVTVGDVLYASGFTDNGTQRISKNNGKYFIVKRILLNQGCIEFEYDKTLTPGHTGGMVNTGKLTNYKWSSVDLTKEFKVGDCIEISGCTAEGSVANNKSIVITGLTATTITVADNGFTAGTETGTITLKRKIPDLDFICESENRLWGCNSEDQTIYASALGDPTNFFTYEGLSTDSYALAVGSEGEFTGCCKLSSSVLFWKETVLHKMLGSYPAEYTLYTYTLEGLKKGCHKSLQVINEVLFYMGLHGVYAYSGGTPSLISSVFGSHEFTDASAGNDGDTYFLSCKEGTNKYFFVYETDKHIWLQEDSFYASYFARIGKNLYFIDEDGYIWLEDGGSEDSSIEWQAQFTPFYETISGRKTYSKILLRLDMPSNSFTKIEVKTDGRVWKEAGRVAGRNETVIPVRLAINRCDKFEIRLSGRGPCTILSMLREFSVRSGK